MNNIHENSLFAYDSIKPIKSEAQKKVFATLSILGQATAFKIAQTLGVSIHKVTGRINELMYENQAIKVIGTENPRKRNIYAVREESDPINKRNLTPDEKLKVFRSWLNSQGLYVDTNLAVRKLDEIINK